MARLGESAAKTQARAPVGETTRLVCASLVVNGRRLFDVVEGRGPVASSSSVSGGPLAGTGITPVI